MDRLYSRFPAGSVGLALLLLRLVDGLGLVRVGIHVYGRRRPVRQPALKTVRELDGSVDIPIRSRIFPIQLAGFAGSRRLFAGRAAVWLANDQAVIPAIDTRRDRLT